MPNFIWVACFLFIEFWLCFKYFNINPLSSTLFAIDLTFCFLYNLYQGAHILNFDKFECNILVSSSISTSKFKILKNALFFTFLLWPALSYKLYFLHIHNHLLSSLFPNFIPYHIHSALFRTFKKYNSNIDTLLLKTSQ